MKVEDVKFDCRFFKGHIPCRPNKEKGEICATCQSYEPKGKRILIIKLGALGDVVRTTPLLTRFREKYPESYITWITLSPAILPSNKIDRIFKYSLEALETIKHEQFDIAINLDKEPETCVLLKDVSAETKFGYTWADDHIAPATEKAEHKLLTGLFDELSQNNTKSYLEEVFEIVHEDFKGEEYILDVNPDHDAKWKEIISEKAEGKKVIGLNTGCGPRWPTRLWPLEYWKALIHDLHKAGYFPMVIGGPEEDQKNKSLDAATIACYPGTHSLQEFIAIMNNCDLVVTAVSMAMHLAIGVKSKLVLFNNIFNKHEFELYGRGTILEPKTGCDDFYGGKCSRERHCMEDLSHKEVLEAIEKLCG